MPSSVCYVDTSALVKRYVAERGSAAFEAFCESDDRQFVISPLVGTEFTGVLRRRLRTGELVSRYAAEARRRFHDDVASGGWRLLALDTAVFARASDLMWTLGAPLATLDAMHLAFAMLHEADSLATSDRQLAAACRKAKLDVHTFE